eukprot:768303-Hanusia_phi.AAC.6
MEQGQGQGQGQGQEGRSECVKLLTDVVRLCKLSIDVCWEDRNLCQQLVDDDAGKDDGPNPSRKVRKEGEERRGSRKGRGEGGEERGGRKGGGEGRTKGRSRKKLETASWDGSDRDQRLTCSKQTSACSLGRRQDSQS